MLCCIEKTTIPYVISKIFEEAYLDSTPAAHGYLLLNLKQSTSEEVRFRTCIFDDRLRYVISLRRTMARKASKQKNKEKVRRRIGRRQRGAGADAVAVDADNTECGCLPKHFTKKCVAILNVLCHAESTRTEEPRKGGISARAVGRTLRFR
ncbi:hypothetical protein TSAR_011107 [Trichomalopsis sarcophagae]|uniref:Uncharacterized protein n=1 Tax=Trichomalopsis sarcophagae TaxID=543379 RepID=A0A232EGB3_9HYME|nr:hypothetical protein TSAR_011107 [Trichomalopsis sarcophagae]